MVTLSFCVGSWAQQHESRGQRSGLTMGPCDANDVCGSSRLFHVCWGRNHMDGSELTPLCHDWCVSCPKPIQHIGASNYLPVWLRPQASSLCYASRLYMSWQDVKCDVAATQWRDVALKARNEGLNEWVINSPPIIPVSEGLGLIVSAGNWWIVLVLFIGTNTWHEGPNTWHYSLTSTLKPILIFLESMVYKHALMNLVSLNKIF